jgi:hypothetical protein
MVVEISNLIVYQYVVMEQYVKTYLAVRCPPSEFL